MFFIGYGWRAGGETKASLSINYYTNIALFYEQLVTDFSLHLDSLFSTTKNNFYFFFFFEKSPESQREIFGHILSLANSL
jgi:hypothetical protein